MVDGISLIRVDTKEVLDLHKISTPYFILKSVDWGVIQSSHHSFKYVNQIGITITGTSLETRDIEINGWVIANTEEEMNERKKVLDRFFDPQVAIELTYKNYSIKFVPDTTIRYGISDEENNDVIAQWKITGVCPDPLFSDKEESSQEIASLVGLFHFPLIMSEESPEHGVVFGYRNADFIAKVNNVGSKETGIRIIFNAKGGVKNPRLINVNTREFFEIKKDLSQDEMVTINTVQGEKYVRGVTSYGEEQNYFKYKSIDSTWLQLSLGENLFRCDADLGVENLEVKICYFNKYLEVQECY